jgi:adenylate cyclase
VKRWRDVLHWSRADDEFWRRHITESQPFPRFMRLGHRLLRATPSDPRCKLCNAPFAGVGGKVCYLVGRGRSRKNPRFCTGCFEHAPVGGLEAKVGVLFADVRGFTALAERKTPEEAARLLNRFYAVATNLLSDGDAVIDKLIGDEVMALFVPAFTGSGYVEKMVSVGEGLLRAVGYGSSEGPWLALGVGIDEGLAFVGNVGSGVVKDFTAIGDVVNTAARLQAQANPGQLVMSERVYETVRARYPLAVQVQFDLKGKREVVLARVVSIT